VTHQEMIDHIMDNFNFDSVHTVMAAIGWEWCDESVPTETSLRLKARGLLKAVVAGPIKYIASGGFEAMFEDGYLKLSFVLENWDANEED